MRIAIGLCDSLHIQYCRSRITFFKRRTNLKLYFASECNRLDKRFMWLLNKHKKLTRSKIRPVQYICATSLQTSDVSLPHVRPPPGSDPPERATTSDEYSLKPLIPSYTSSAHEIILKSSAFQDPSPSPLQRINGLSIYTPRTSHLKYRDSYNWVKIFVCPRIIKKKS